MTASRPKSAAIISGLRFSRSTQTPAGSAKRTNGRIAHVPSIETSNALEWRILIAAKPIPRKVTCEPTWLIVCADQSFRKSRCRQSPLRSAIGDHRTGAYEQVVLDDRLVRQPLDLAQRGEVEEDE